MSRGASGTSMCGWCITSHHDQCKPETKYYDKVWQCSCKKCHPEVISKDEGVTNEEVVEEPIQDQGAETA